MIINKYLTKINFEKRKNKENKYIVIHYTANNGDTAKGNCSYFYNVNRNSSAHYFVDENSIYQCVLNSDVAWHCGASRYKHKECRNTNSIGIEMCSKKDKNGIYYIDERTVKNTIELVKQLMKQYKISEERVLRHYDVTGKMCPEPFVRNEAKWLDFKQNLTEKKEEMEVVTEGKAIVNGKEYKIDRILKDGENYIKVANFRNMGFDVGYNKKTKAIIIDNTLNDININSQKINAININDNNYIKIREIAKILNYNVTYENKKISLEKNKEVEANE